MGGEGGFGDVSGQFQWAQFRRESIRVGRALGDAEFRHVDADPGLGNPVGSEYDGSRIGERFDPYDAVLREGSQIIGGIAEEAAQPLGVGSEVYDFVRADAKDVAVSHRGECEQVFARKHQGQRECGS